jgi:glycosyltransferase involved in cell wall biosynthesis
VRYAIVHSSFAVQGGTEVLIVDLANELVRRGHRVTLLAGHTAGSSALEELSRAVPVVDLGAAPTYFDKMSLRDWARTGRHLAGLLDGHDVLSFHGLPSPMWWSTAVRVRPGLARIPSVWYCHGLVGWLYDDVAGVHMRTALEAYGRGQDRAGWDLAKARVAVMRARGMRWSLGKLWRVARAGAGDARPEFMAVEREAVRLFSAVLANSAFTAGNVREIFGIEAVVCHPGLASTKLPEAVGPPGEEMLTVARLQFSKNLEGILAAVAELRRRGPLPFRLYRIVGAGDQYGDLRRRAAELGIADAVHFMGSVAGRDLDTCYQRAGLFALPAFDEGFGLVYLEAAARGRASLAPSHGGPAEIVVDGETGWLVDSTDVGGMADAIAGAFAAPEELRRRGLAARRRFEAQFSTSRFVDRFEAAIGAVVGAQASGLASG